MKELPKWFKPADADKILIEKFGHQEPGLFIRLYFVQFVLTKEVKDNYDHIWVLWLPEGQFRYYTDPVKLSGVWHTAKFYDTEIKVFDENNSHNLPEEFIDTIYLPHESHAVS